MYNSVKRQDDFNEELQQYLPYWPYHHSYSLHNKNQGIPCITGDAVVKYHDFQPAHFLYKLATN